MKIILTQTVENVGLAGDEKDVKPGFARNFLLVRKLAVLPSDRRAKQLRKERHALEQTVASQKNLIQELANQWRHQQLTVLARASEDGTLYGSVGRKEILKALGRDDVDLDLPVLKKVGKHAIQAHFIDGTAIPLTVVIEAEERAATERTKK